MTCGARGHGEKVDGGFFFFVGGGGSVESRKGADGNGIGFFG